MYIPAHFAADDDLDKIAAFVQQAGTADLVTFDGTQPVATLLPVIWERPEGPPGGTGSTGVNGSTDTNVTNGATDTNGAASTNSSNGANSATGTSASSDANGRTGHGSASTTDDEDAGAAPGYGRLLGHIALNNPQWSTAQPGVPALAIVRGPEAYISPSWYQSTREHGRTVPTWNYVTVHFTGPVTFHRDPDWLRDIVTRLTEKYEEGREGRWWVNDAPEKFIAGQLRAIVGVEMAIQRVEAKSKLSQNRTPQDRVNVIAALRAEPGAGPHAIAELMAERQEAERQEAERQEAERQEAERQEAEREESPGNR